MQEKLYRERVQKRKSDKEKVKEKERDKTNGERGKV